MAGNFQAKDPHMAKYLDKVREMTANFDDFGLIHVPREQNARANLLSKLASTKRLANHRLVIQENLAAPSVIVEKCSRSKLNQGGWRCTSMV